MTRISQTARAIRDARVQAGLSQRALATRANTTQAVIARLELGLASPVLDTLERLARAAGFELQLELRRKPVLDRQLLDDVPRILRMSPEQRLREVANINRFAADVRRTG